MKPDRSLAEARNLAKIAEATSIHILRASTTVMMASVGTAALIVSAFSDNSFRYYLIDLEKIPHELQVMRLP